MALDDLLPGLRGTSPYIERALQLNTLLLKIWLVIDLITWTQAPAEYAAFPCLWLLTAINYRMNIKSLSLRFKRIRSQQLNLIDSEMRSLQKAYLRLAKESNDFNRASAPCLSLIIITGIPIFNLN